MNRLPGSTRLRSATSNGVLITDHNVQQTLSITDRAYIITDGAILEEGSPADLVNSQRAREVYLGEGFRL